jgi:small subunit ribosomal protein S1
VLKRSQKIEAIILDIDKENRQLALGYKQTKEDPFYRFSTEFKVGDVISGRIVELARLGIIVSLPHGIEGYVPRSQLVNKFQNKEEGEGEVSKYQVGENVELKIAYFDFDTRKIGLSEKALFTTDVVREEEVVVEVEKVKPRRGRKRVRSEREEALEEEMKAGGVKFTFEDHLDDDSKQIRGRRRK